MFCKYVTFKANNVILKTAHLRLQGYNRKANINNLIRINKNVLSSTVSLCNTNTSAYHTFSKNCYIKSTSSIPVRFKSTEDKPKKTNESFLTRVQKLKKAVAEYGSTVIVFHVSISLISLGIFYLLVTAGLDTSQVFAVLGLDEWANRNVVASNAGTFAVAYVLHKVFAPVRITITLASVPFIVRYLRRIGFLKK